MKDSEIMRNLMNEMSVDNYKLTNTDELMEFLWIKPSLSGINVDLFVDDSGSYKRNNHVLLLFARNGYDKSVSEFIPFSVSEKPEIVDNSIDYNISYNDIFLIQDFIQINYSLIPQLGNDKISQTQFVNSVKKLKNQVFY